MAQRPPKDDDRCQPAEGMSPSVLQTQPAAAPRREPSPLICYAISEEPPALRPAPPTRQWMDESSDAFAYRCLPLSIANGHGWELLNPSAFEATWQGAKDIDGIKITPLDGGKPLATSHFGSGVLTFHIHALFRTLPGVNLWVSGPTNRPKHGIQPLHAVIETDWTYATFTMNWIFTAPGTVRFERDEPFCFFFPLARGNLNNMEPELLSVSDDRAVYDGYVSWRAERARFLRQLSIAGTEAHEAGWEKAYFQGRQTDNTKIPDHQTKLRLKPFVDRRGQRR
jgi:uncharacterized protein DUF6065